MPNKKWENHIFNQSGPLSTDREIVAETDKNKIHMTLDKQRQVDLYEFNASLVQSEFQANKG